VRWTPYQISLADYRKLIVGEGESDRNFFKAFCTANAIAGFDFAFTGMHTEPPYVPSGFAAFARYLPTLERQTHFDRLTDLVLVCDTGQAADRKLRQLQRQIRTANRVTGRIVFTENPVANVIAAAGIPRVHVLMIPRGRDGGLETICVDVARDHQNDEEHNRGTAIQGWVDTFANSACGGWTTEKRDKLRLQAFLSAAYRSKPDLHFSQLFDLTKGRLVPLTGAAFDDIRQFLRGVEAL
jgi:hypothetical protein